MNLTKSFSAVQKAGRSLTNLGEDQINTVLADLADAIIKNVEEILTANKKDLARMDEKDPKYDRLLLNEDRIKGIAAEMKNVAALASPLGEVLEKRTLENGLELTKVRVPMGVIGIIYEARPNVTFDVFSICFKAGSACILKGGSDAKDSNEAAVKIIHNVLSAHGIDTNVVFLMPPEREHVQSLLEAKNFVDLIIQRGSKSLIDFVVANSKVPVIETGAGIVHTYFDESGNLEMGARIIFNAKTRRPSVCNALDTLIIHESRLADLPALTEKLAEENVQVFADEKSFASMKNNYPNELLRHATEESFGTEFLSLKMSIKTVASPEEAVEHITKFSSKHSEAIISNDQNTIDYFLKNVDSGTVYVNASTAFTDGAQFGLGAEIGISTQKLHARGPMSLREISTYKWLIKGSGQIRRP